jgi:hypothetical protein
MTRRLLWMILAAGLLAVTATAARAQCSKAGCCKDAKSCCPACTKECCQGCCMECWEEECPAGCCAGCCPGGQAACKSPKNVMIFRIGAQPWNGPIPPWMPNLPPLPTPVPPLPPPWPASADMMPPAMPLYKEYLTHEPRTYSVELKTLEGNGDQTEAVTMCPKLMVPEGHGCMVSFDGQEAVLGKCVAACPKMQPCGHSGGVVQVQVVGEKDGEIDLDLHVQQTEIEKTSKEGMQVLSHSLHVVRTVSLGKATRLVLDRSCGGTPTRWLEVRVSPGETTAMPPVRTACSDAPCCPACRMAERLPPPREAGCEECSPAGIDVVFDVVGEVLSELASCFFPPYTEEQEQITLPSGKYLQHPPQYLPVAMPCPCPQGAPIQMCAAAVTERMAPAIHVKVPDGESRLEITCGGGVRMACKKMDLNLADSPWTLAAAEGQVRLKAPQVQACANEISTDQKDLLILKGKVRLSYTKDGQSAAILADCIEISFTDGTLKVKP